MYQNDEILKEFDKNSKVSVAALSREYDIPYSRVSRLKKRWKLRKTALKVLKIEEKMDTV